MTDSAPQFVSLTGAGKILGLTRQRIQQMSVTGKMPEPAAFVEGRPVWRPDDVLRMADERAGLSNDG